MRPRWARPAASDLNPLHDGKEISSWFRIKVTLRIQAGISEL
jgi:hypothetical protein